MGGGRSRTFHAAAAQGISTRVASQEATCVEVAPLCSCGEHALLALAGVFSKHVNEHMEQLVCTAPMPELASTVTAMALKNITARMAAGRK